MSSKAPAPAPATPAPVAPESSALEQYVETHFSKILTGFGVIVVAAIGLGAYSFMSNRAAESAAMEAAKVKTTEDCDLVVQHHPGTVAAGNALLSKAKFLWDANKKDTAVGVLREFVAKYSSHPFIGQGTLGLATRLEAMGGKAELAEAKTIYEGLVKNQPKSDIGALAQMRLGDMLWNEGKQDEAKKVYEALPQKLTGSPFFEHNEERLKWLAANLPTKEVEGPKPPPDALKAPTPGAPALNLNSGAGSPLGGLMNNLKTAAPGADIKVQPGAASGKPVAVPTPPKPGVATPGAAIPVQVKPGATATSAPVQVPAPAAPAKPAATPPAPAPAKEANPAKPSSAAATPAPAPAPAAPAPAKP